MCAPTLFRYTERSPFTIIFHGVSRSDPTLKYILYIHLAQTRQRDCILQSIILYYRHTHKTSVRSRLVRTGRTKYRGIVNKTTYCNSVCFNGCNLRLDVVTMDVALSFYRIVFGVVLQTSTAGRGLTLP